MIHRLRPYAFSSVYLRQFVLHFARDGHVALRARELKLQLLELLHRDGWRDGKREIKNDMMMMRRQKWKRERNNERKKLEKIQRR